MLTTTIITTVKHLIFANQIKSRFYLIRENYIIIITPLAMVLLSQSSAAPYIKQMIKTNKME